jgi:hypothetical protein
MAALRGNVVTRLTRFPRRSVSLVVLSDLFRAQDV